MAALISGIVSIVFGLAVAGWSILGAMAIVGVIVGFAIFLGVLLLAAGLGSGDFGAAIK